MSAPLPHPSTSSGDGTSGRATALGKLSLATQQQCEREQLLAAVAKSRESVIDKINAHNLAAPATPSSVDHANRLYQRSAEKLLKQPAIASVATVVAIPIPERSSIQEHDTDKGEDHGTNLLDREVAEETTFDPADEETDADLTATDKGDKTRVKSNLPRLINLVCLPSMDQETVVDDPNFVFAAAHLCKSVGDQTSMMSLCINCN